MFKIAHFGIWCWVILGAAIGPIVDGWSLREAIMKKQIMLGIIVGVAVIACLLYTSDAADE